MGRGHPVYKAKNINGLVNGLLSTKIKRKIFFIISFLEGDDLRHHQGKPDDLRHQGDVIHQCEYVGEAPVHRQFAQHEAGLPVILPRLRLGKRNKNLQVLQ